jgi:glycerophosphoryl diester phosphodiesterase
MPIRPLSPLPRRRLSAPVLALDLQAHRGGPGLRPENTLAAFENAIRMGVTTLELDIAITADGVAVISHEPLLYPGTARDADGRWLKEPGPRIRSLTLAEVQRYDVGRLNPDSAYGKPFATQQPVDGQRIPTLASLFALVEQARRERRAVRHRDQDLPESPDDTVSPEVFVDTLLAAIRAAG